MSQVPEVAGESYGNRRHSSRLSDQLERPSVNKCYGRMIGFPQVRVLATQMWAARGKLGIDKSSGERDQPARDPCAQNQGRRMNLSSNNVRVDKDA